VDKPLETKLRRGKGLTMVVGLALSVGGVAPIGIAQPVYIPKPDTSCRSQILAFRLTEDAASRSRMIACTDSVDSVFHQNRLDRTDAESARLVKMFFDIPEYHDEGRLPAGRDSRGPFLGPVAGIYASPFLHGFTRPAQIYEQGLRGTLAALVVVDLQSGETVPPAYQKLQLASGLNCVWLAVDPPDPGMSKDTAYLNHLHYRAYISHPTEPTNECDRSGTMGAELSVVAVRNASFAADSSYPAVARFDTDRSGNLVLGFRCLNAFCEVGPTNEGQIRMPDGLVRSGSQTVAQWRTTTPTSVSQGERETVKLWHDEQALAIRDDYFIWRPSVVRARIVPEPSAATLDSVDFIRWRRVATIFINDTVPRSTKYFGWGLRKGKNYVEFQYSERFKWQARIVREDGAIIPWPYMKRVLHYDISVPPITRFRWTGIDDGVWAPCGQACCKAAGS
jgi:hypothetical protein